MKQNSDKKIIAVTGGIGSGKSSVCKYLADKGYPVVDCDDLSRKAADDKDVLTKISDTFGSKFVKDGKLLRRALAREVFADQQKTQKLNAIFHPVILEMLLEQIRQTKGKTVFVELQVPQKEIIDVFDVVWLVKCADDTAQNRDATRDGRDKEEIKNLIARQKSALEKAEKDKKTIVLTNDGTLTDLYDKTDCLIKTALLP